MKKHYTATINPPKNNREGLINFVQMIINDIEAGNVQEALYRAVDLRQDLDSNASPYDYTAKGLTPSLDRAHACERLLSHALKYLEHPDVQAVTETMALPGNVIVKRIKKHLGAEA